MASRAAGAMIRREDWFLLAVMLVGAGMALNDAARDGDRSAFRGSVFDLLSPAGWRHFFAECGSHPVQCARDTLQRTNARAYFELGVIAVGLTVALRKFMPRWSGIPYGALLLITAVLLYLGALDPVVRALDPRRILAGLGDALGDLGGGLVIVRPPGQTPPGKKPPATTPPPAPPAGPCYSPDAVCGGGRGGPKVLPGGARVLHPTGRPCPAVECNDGSIIDAQTLAVVAPPRAAGCIPVEVIARTEGAVRQRYLVPGQCGYALFASGRVYDLRNKQIVSSTAWREIARRWGFVPAIIERGTR